jgi:Fatty acid desaturase
MGGLNYQIEHHLFPSMARPHLRKAQPLVAAYCAAQGVPYTRPTRWQSYRAVIGYLNTVGLRGKTPSCAPWLLNAEPSSQNPTPQVEAEWRRQAQLGPAEHGLRPEHRCPRADRAAGPPLRCGERLTRPGQGSPLFTPGVSDQRCKWPNTPSCGLAGKGRYDRNTVGRESTTIE